MRLYLAAPKTESLRVQLVASLLTDHEIASSCDVIERLIALGIHDVVSDAAVRAGVSLDEIVSHSNALQVRRARAAAFEELDARGWSREQLAHAFGRSLRAIARDMALFPFRKQDAPPESEKRSLGLVEGNGEKRDCARYEQCLDAYARASNRAAHCPPSCAGFVPFDRYAELVRAQPRTSPGFGEAQ